jgi:hypothetical protein
VLRLNFNKHLAGGCAFGQWNLDIHISNWLGPDVSLCFTSVVSADSLVDFFFRLL